MRSRDFARLDVFSAHSHGRADARRSTQVKRREAVAAVVLGRDAVTLRIRRTAAGLRA